MEIGEIEKEQDVQPIFDPIPREAPVAPPEFVPDEEEAEVPA